MAFGSMDTSDYGSPIAEINMVPLIDVMLVLLIIFIVAAPLLTHAVKVDLPKAESMPAENRRDSVQLTVDAEHRIFWNGEMISRARLGERLAVASRIQPQPELHLHVERAVTYEIVAQIMSDAAKNGMTRIGFVTDPAVRP